MAARWRSTSCLRPETGATTSSAVTSSLRPGEVGSYPGDVPELLTPVVNVLVQAPILTVFLVIGLGTALGQIPFGPIRFGAAGALFVGLAVGGSWTGLPAALQVARASCAVWGWGCSATRWASEQAIPSSATCAASCPS